MRIGFLQRLCALAAALGILGALVIPGFSLEDEVLCGKAEHQHGDVCHTVREYLSCSPHTHEENCLDEAGNLICGEADFWLHVHEEACAQRQCSLPERIPHTHGVDCVTATDGTVSCGQEEWIPHTHSDSCLEDNLLICPQLQLQQHTHDSSCFATEMVLSCQQEEHTHEAGCYPQEETTLPTEAPILPVAEEVITYSAAAADDDRPAVAEPGIRFGLFDYSNHINKDASLTTWRPLADYFTFRNSAFSTGDTPSDTIHIPAHNINSAHDADGFPATHATVERTLSDGLPVLDLTRNADGTMRTDPGLSAETRSLAYLFRNSGDHAVTAYSPGNTILQKDGNRYYYDSRSNAVDYDADANLFRVRSYPERNSTTAGYGDAFGDFLPFNHTGGVAVGTNADKGTDYHILSENVNYWFGMSMEVSFFQSKEGKLGGENMVFRFSGDDDVWVFVDDVLVLDLGGTHGTVDGTIDFATGQVLQYLSWNGANTTEEARAEGSATSFPTTLKACFDAAGRIPNGGWSGDGNTFADYTQHKLTFFYLERGAAVANCRLDFRLPVLPDKSLTVTKELTAEGEMGDFLRDTLSYRFRVVKTDDLGNSTGELYLTPGTKYTLLENGSAVGSAAVDSDGTVSLKAGQSAQFTDMLVKGGGAKTYAVQEILPDELTGQYAGIEYSISGDGGLTKTEEGPEEGFAAFTTPSLSAEQTQMVTFRNRVDTARLSRLKVTKLAAEGSVFPEGAVFPIRVTLGGQPLPAGTQYQVGEEIRTVESPGMLHLRLGETALVLRGILSGTEFAVTEPEIPGLNGRPSYDGRITPSGELSCGPDGVTGIFPLGSTAEVTVTNASFDYAVEIPISKQTPYQEKLETFSFRLTRVTQDTDGTWSETEQLPGTTITVTGDAVTPGRLLVGFPADAEGIFHYRVEESTGTGNYLYDKTFYIVQITVSEGTASITEVLKNGTTRLPADTRLPFINHRTTSLLVTKTVEGGSREEPFRFTAMVTHAGESTLTEFTLTHGEQFLLPNIPWGAEITVLEEPHEYYISSYRIADDLIPGNTASLTADRDDMTVHFLNRCAYELPETGGSGVNPYTLGGVLQMTAAGCLLYFQRKREKGDPKSY